MAWHSAGTYRIGDGRGGGGRGQQRFAPLNSWPDNVSLDKARRLLWPIKQKYGRKISWADLMILTGNVALETHGLQDLRLRRRPRRTSGSPTRTCTGAARRSGSAATSATRRARRASRKATACSSRTTTADGDTHTRNLENPLGRRADGPDLRQPRRPGRQPRPARRGARHPRHLRPHGDGRRGDRRPDRRRPHFGKTHGAAPGLDNVGNEPEAADLEAQGLGWHNSFGTGKGGDTITSGLEVTWTTTPTKWSNNFFENLFGFEWELTKSPAGAQQWVAKDGAGAGIIPHAHDPSKKLPPTMLTTDLSLRFDPAYEKISRRFLANPDQFADAFARAWFKLTHRDMGPRARYLGPEVPAEELIWQDPIPAVDHPLVDAQDIASLKKKVLASGLTVAAARVDRLGLGLDLPRLRQARRRQRRAHPPRAAEGLGRQPARAAGARC